MRFELVGERAGRKPVVFLSVEAEGEAALRAEMGALHVERGVRTVRVGAGDRWGEGGERTYVELFASRDPELARRAKALQDEDPTRNARALGALLGYPACCVDAFVAQSSRADNSRNRIETAARTRAAMPWPWELSNVDRMIVPFFPCTYDCAAALAEARAVIAQAERERPGTESELRRALRGAMIYVDQDRWIAIEGEPLGHDRARIERVRTSPAEERSELAQELSRADTLGWDDALLHLERAGSPTHTAPRGGVHVWSFA
jgi:hypothetical protein